MKLTIRILAGLVIGLVGSVPVLELLPAATTTALAKERTGAAKARTERPSGRTA